MDENFTAVKTAFENYAAQVAKIMEAHKSDIDAAVQKALAAHDSECDADLKTLLDEISAANAKLVPPPFEPSANG